jgi:hypothetical protein
MDKTNGQRTLAASVGRCRGGGNHVLTLPRCDELRSSDFGGFEVTVTSKSVLTVYFHMGGLYFMLQ